VLHRQKNPGEERWRRDMQNTGEQERTEQAVMEMLN